MVKRSSEPASEGAAPKPKKMVGKMKVQGSILFLIHFSSYIYIELSIHTTLNFPSILSMSSSKGENVTGPAYGMQYFSSKSSESEDGICQTSFRQFTNKSLFWMASC